MSIRKALSLSDSLFSHQTCLLVGDSEYWRNFLQEEIRNYFEISNLNLSADVWWQSFESFGIKEAHSLIEREVRHGFGEKGRFFILEILSITPEAQNALLKTFEEPTAGAHFFIIARSAEIFLPTILSRMIILNSEIEAREVGFQVNPKSNFASANDFLKLDLPDRLEFIQKEFLKKPARLSDGKDMGKSEIIEFVAELERAFRARVDLRKITKDQENALYEIGKCFRYLNNPRSSNRLILEHLALILPN